MKVRKFKSLITFYQEYGDEHIYTQRPEDLRHKINYILARKGSIFTLCKNESDIVDYVDYWELVGKNITFVLDEKEDTLNELIQRGGFVEV